MPSTSTMHSDQIWQVIADRHNEDLRFRSAVITSTALHTGVTLAILLAPLLISRPQLFQLTPVNMVQMQAPAPEPVPTPPPAEEEPEEQAPEPEPAEPEPAEPEPPQPEDVPENLEAQRRAEEEEAARRREERLAEERRERDAEEERERLADEARRRRAAEEAEARRRAEEEARAQPQVATRRPTQEQPTEITQQAERGEVGMSFGEELSETEKTLLDYWINRVLTNINRNWQPQVRPAGSREIVAVVHFRVDRNGQLIVGPDVRSGSGNRSYDDAAARAVSAGQPFPPLPQAYRGSTLTINLAFRQE